MTSTPVVLQPLPAPDPLDGAPAASAVVEFLAGVDGLLARSERAGAGDVAAALARPRPDLADLATLLSPAAAGMLEDMARRAHARTLARFGRAVRLFAPLYLSNQCVSTCTYCGFSAPNQVARRTLTSDEVRAEARELASRGFRHLLLVSGEHARVVSPDYLCEVVSALAPDVPSLAVEVQVWGTEVYRRLVESGCEGVVAYQETYHPDTYAGVHLKGRKRNYAWRLAGADRAAAAGMRRVGLGALLGLHDDWRHDVLALAAHAGALVHHWWRCEVTVAVPRLRPAAGGYSPARPVGDRELAQIICALRLVLPDVGVTLSTREPARLRDGLVRLGVTQMSAGSSTEPGGYRDPGSSEAQFEVSDRRSPAEVAAALAAAGYEPVWMDTLGARRRGSG